MDEQQPSGEMSIGQLGHRPGLHVSVNLQGKTIGGELIDGERWAPGVVIGAGGDGTFVTVKLDTPLGGGERHGLMRRESRGEDIVSFDDPARIQPLEVDPDLDGASAEIVELARAGKTLQAIKRYRALNGATYDEARAFIAKL